MKFNIFTISGIYMSSYNYDSYTVTVKFSHITDKHIDYGIFIIKPSKTLLIFI